MTPRLTSARTAALVLVLVAAACSKKSDMSRNGTTTDSAGASVGATAPGDTTHMGNPGATTSTAAGAMNPSTPSAAPSGTNGVSQISLGKHIDANKQVTDTTSTFAPHDTIYLTVMTGSVAPNSKLTARWSYGKGQVVKESSQTLANPSSAAATEFHLSKKSAWPAGSYMVEVLVNGQSAGTKNFTVQ